MDQQLAHPKSALKKNHRSSSPRNKVRFAEDSARSSAGTEMRKRQVQDNVEHTKKSKTCQEVQVIHEITDLLVGTPSQLKHINKKLEETAQAYCDQYLALAEAACILTEFENRAEFFETDLTIFENYLEQCPEEVDMNPLITMAESAIEAECTWQNLLSTLEGAINIVDNDKLELLDEEMTSIQRLIQRMNAFGPC